MAQPEAYMGGVAALFDDRGNLINESTKGFLKNFMVAFEKWIVANAQPIQQDKNI